MSIVWFVVWFFVWFVVWCFFRDRVLPRPRYGFGMVDLGIKWRENHRGEYTVMNWECRGCEKPKSLQEPHKPAKSRKSLEAQKPRSQEAEKPRSQEAKKPEAKKPRSREAKKPRSQEAKKPRSQKARKKTENNS